MITFNNICFATGTLIRTVDGDVAVEALKIGDIVVTASGTQRPIHWIGHRRVNCRHSSDPRASWPVRIAAHAFGENLPARDLFVSPQHSVAVNCLEEVLIPIKYLINGGSIAQVPRDEVTYWHVELDTHDILLSEGLPTESFLDTQGRVGFFDNGAEYAAAHPDQPLKTMDEFCRPLILDGPVIKAVREQLTRRMTTMGWSVTQDNDLHVLADGHRIESEVFGSVARFTVPAGTRELRVCSQTFVPAQFEIDSGDGRTLGVPLKGITVTDGFTTNAVAIGDASLIDGFNVVQSDDDCTWRWTDGNAVIPSSLWKDCQGGFFLRLDIAAERGAYKSWAPPADAAVEDAESTTPVYDLGFYRARVA